MTLVEAFTYSLANAILVNQELLHYSASSAGGYVALGDVATWVTAIATLGLVVGVGFAYKQIKDNRRLHDDQQQLKAVADYITAIQFFENRRVKDEEELVARLNQIHNTGVLFTLVFRIVQNQTLTAIRDYENMLSNIAHIEFNMRSSRPYATLHASYNKSLSELAGQATNKLPQLRLPTFTVDDISKEFTAAVDRAEAQHPDYFAQALAFKNPTGY